MQTQVLDKNSLSDSAVLQMINFVMGKAECVFKVPLTATVYCYACTSSNFVCTKIEGVLVETIVFFHSCYCSYWTFQDHIFILVKMVNSTFTGCLDFYMNYKTPHDKNIYFLCYK